ncbi:protein GLUTAMINE DUMPER 6 [Oryza sativa Japonica Group]|uniref:Os02g0191800 protein n=7 Tax=Oryza TaxID=4527 RepID=Q0E364_ORYSJ|nr:protein GLUTAMINE DUMPER 6 [Oryza sativa Japonica Group]KAB8086247.1 hypothetical protein EE612_009438 [Oryza sativa]KAF2943544.1 hypothetical protein DAI22_02g071750 [Oryza sativa Japonica Group]BAF08074.1 Os02g0191800 [Oryza sativa Japonica Group]BAG88599.1 unnamed protein product [Oryza sativa Japonica Group]BAS77409.1 Os02g0191800 [Oryza sativa Japonica Group]|eukprot:NP_001046160.1 Os02g0191800 [Oryza sativa Japonica Group]
MRPAGAADMAMGGIGGAAASTSSVPAMPAAVAPPPFWSTPTPYLFIGFGVVMALIAVALAVLLCTRRKDGGRGVGGEERGDVVVPPGMMSVRVLAPLDREAPPRVVVVMAGDDSPSFLASATPLAFAAAAATGVPLAPAPKVVAPPQP